MARRGGARFVEDYVRDRITQSYLEYLAQLSPGAPLPDGPFSFLYPYADPKDHETLGRALRDTDRRLHASWGCVTAGLVNIHALSIPDYPDGGQVLGCSHVFGRHLLLSLLDLFGEAAFSSALQELHLLSLNPSSPTEEEIYGVFLKHTPPGLEQEFRALYKRVHGGPFLDAGS